MQATSACRCCCCCRNWRGIKWWHSLHFTKHSTCCDCWFKSSLHFTRRRRGMKRERERVLAAPTPKTFRYNYIYETNIPRDMCQFSFNTHAGWCRLWLVLACEGAWMLLAALYANFSSLRCGKFNGTTFAADLWLSCSFSNCLPDALLMWAANKSDAKSLGRCVFGKERRSWIMFRFSHSDSTSEAKKKKVGKITQVRNSLNAKC